MIKKIRTIIFLLLTLSSVIYGQSFSSELKVTQNDDWQIFSPAEEEFSAQAPVTFFTGFINIATSTTTKNRLYKANVGSNYFYIFSDDLKSPVLNEMAFKFAGIAADRDQQNVIFQFTDRFGYHHRLLNVKTLKRVYTFQTVSLIENEPQLDRFFSGIKINFISLNIKKSFPESGKQPAEALPKSEPKPTTAVATGSGSGSGSGIGPGSAVSNSTSASIKQATTVKILSKPRPSYSHFARLYEIDGVVRLKVTFQANGEIGKITPSLTLPFGLTEEAIEAAKQLTFEPATIEGKAVTLIKTIEYSFSML